MLSRGPSQGGDAEKALPEFPGTRGPDIVRSLIDIENMFAGHLRRLQGVSYPILDVKATQWHDDYSSFKNGVKELEGILTNSIDGAFKTVETIEVGVQFLEAFSSLAKREAIKRCVEKKTAQARRTMHSRGRRRSVSSVVWLHGCRLFGTAVRWDAPRMDRAGSVWRRAFPSSFLCHSRSPAVPVPSSLLPPQHDTFV